MGKVRFEEDGGLGVVTLDSPPLNLIGEELIADLITAVDQIEATGRLHALLVRSEAKVFSAGADVKLFAAKGAAEMRPLIASFLDLGARIEALPFPTVAAVHGTCMAGGFERRADEGADDRDRRRALRRRRASDLGRDRPRATR